MVVISFKTLLLLTICCVCDAAYSYDANEHFEYCKIVGARDAPYMKSDRDCSIEHLKIIAQLIMDDCFFVDNDDRVLASPKVFARSTRDESAQTAFTIYELLVLEYSATEKDKISVAINLKNISPLLKPVKAKGPERLFFQCDSSDECIKVGKSYINRFRLGCYKDVHSVKREIEQYKNIFDLK